MVVCDEDGMVYDIWFHPASYHEVRSLRIRHKMSNGLDFRLKILNLLEIKVIKGVNMLKYVKINRKRVKDKLLKQ
jgi:hypothetical protein